MRFKKAGQFPTDNEAIKAALKNYAISTFHFDIAESGIENATFIIYSGDGKYVLRVYRYDKKRSAIEIKFMSYLKLNGIPVPEVFPNYKGNQISNILYENMEWQYILMEFLPGHHAKDYSENLINELATYQAKIHLCGERFAKENPGAKKLKQLRETEFIHLINQEQLKDKEIANLISRGKDYIYNFPAGLPEGYSHFDYDAENILSDDSGKIAGIIDFDDMQYAPLVMCLAYTMWSVLIVSDDHRAIAKYLHSYNSVRPLSEKEKAAIQPIMLFRHYVIAALKTLSGKMDEGRLAYYLKYERFIKELCFYNQ